MSKAKLSISYFKKVKKLCIYVVQFLKHKKKNPKERLLQHEKCNYYKTGRNASAT